MVAALRLSGGSGRRRQDEAMKSNKDLKTKYKSVQDYEDDFM